MNGASTHSFSQRRLVSKEVMSPYGYANGTQVSVLVPITTKSVAVFFSYMIDEITFSFVNTTDFGLPVVPLV